jgi:hypothetical protein
MYQGENAMGRNVVTDNFSEPLDGATTAVVDINASDGNMKIDGLSGGQQRLASGALQYVEFRDQPARSVIVCNGQATLMLRANGAGRPWFRLPWAACNGATEWQIHLNPTVVSKTTAHSNGGNVVLNLAGMVVTHVAADTGGGNMDVALPDNATDLSVTARTGAGNVTVELGNGLTGSNSVDAKSGAGNVVVRIPSGVAAKIRATTGLGKASVDPRFIKTNGATYQSPDYDAAADKVEITIHSGAGNVSVDTK